jgi:hypothetical protein
MICVGFCVSGETVRASEDEVLHELHRVLGEKWPLICFSGKVKMELCLW